MTAAAIAALAKANTLGISLVLDRAGDGAACLLWRGPRRVMTEDLKAALTANKADLLEHLKAERATEIMAALSSAYDRIRRDYPHAEDEGLPEVERQLPDLYAVSERLEWEVDTAAVAYHRGSGSLQSFLSALNAWESSIVDGVAALAAMRSGKLCADCGVESPIAMLTTLGQRFCSTCARADAVAARGAGPPRRPSP